MDGFIALLGWLLWLGVILALLRHWRKFNKPRGSRFWLIFFLLFIVTPLTSLFIGIRLPARWALPPPGIPVDPLGPALMVFAAIPWFLALGWLGLTPAAILAAFSGLLLALWETHNPFTPLLLALLAVIGGALVNQRYRTWMYQILRHPFVAAFVLALLYPLIYMIGATLFASGPLVTRLDYALTHVGTAAFIQAFELLVAGLVAEMVALGLPSMWAYQGALEPSPAEKSLQTRFMYAIMAAVSLLIVALMAAAWYSAGNVARQILRERMRDAAQMAARSVPFFLEVGQSQVAQLVSDSRLYSSSAAELEAVLAEDIRRVPYFTQLYILDENGESLIGYPGRDYNSSNASPEELVGVQLALEGLPFQTFTVQAEEEGKAAQVSFVATITDQEDTVRRILVARTDLSENLFTSPVLNSIASVIGEDGEGLLLDENGKVLYHTEPGMVMTQYSGEIPPEASFYDDTAPDGTRRLVYYQPAEGRPWAIVLSVPARQAQQIALLITAPMLVIIILIALGLIVFSRLGLNVITRSFQTLTVQASNIARGQLDHPLPVEGEDEIAQLGRSFEQMRISLKATLGELNRLLVISQGVASSLEMPEAVKPVLDAALGVGAQSARVVLLPSVVPDLARDATGPVVYIKGPSANKYRKLDDQILNLTGKQERLVIPTVAHTHMISFETDTPRPASLMAVALRHENKYYGTLWIAFDEPHQFTESEVRFLVTMAGQAALAAANAQHFLNAEIGRQRLAAILASTPDPVLVTDQQNRLLLANPAAWKVLGLGVEWDEGEPIDGMINQEELVDLLRATGDEKRSDEITLSDERVYFATSTSVMAEGKSVGRVCVLRDVTHFKELDALKSEFVATVSHDLRSPLTLIRGYATMLDMVGELNDQQINYVRKIIGGVENISHLVNNLLDLGRIEAGVDLQLELVPVYDVVEQVTSSLQLQATQKRIQLKTEFPQETIPLLEADQALLQQALYNLVENGVKYTEPGGKVQLRIDSRQDYMAFVISDTGIGISPMDQPRLFEMFYRGAHQASRGQSGTGLGLAIVKSIVERHGGKVWVESKLGKGSTFFMIIPLRQEKENQSHRVPG